MTLTMQSRKKKEKRAAAGESRDDQLVAIAGALFAEKGYEGTSLRDIAEAAGMTKAALYYWFPEKEALFQRVVAARMEILMERAQEAVGDVTSPMEKIRRFMLSNARMMDDNRFSWMASSNTFWSNFDVEQRQAVVPGRDQYEGLLRQFIVEAIEQSQFRDIDPSIAGKFLLSGLNFMPRWHKPEGRLTAVQVMEQYLDFAFQGMVKQD